MLHLKLIDAIGHGDLQMLISEGIREGQRIDYKRDINLASPRAKAEFLRDISSFANASGGDILVGMDESEGLPVTLSGIALQDFEALEQQISAICRSQLDPPVTGIRMRPVQLKSGQSAFVIRIPRTWNGPHMVMFEGENRCWTRSSSGKHMMDIPDLKHAFAYSEGAAERMKKFRMERVFSIAAAETAIPLAYTQCAILHVLPLISFTGSFEVDVLKVPDVSLPLMRATASKRVASVFEGKMAYSTEQGEIATQYCLIFRNGVIEVCADLLPRRQTSVTGSYFFAWHQKMIKDVFAQVIQLATAIQIPTPSFGMLSLTGVKGYSVYPSDPFSYCPAPIPLQRDVLPLPEFVIEDYSTPLDQLLKTTFDVWWQSCGSCPQG